MDPFDHERMLLRHITRCTSVAEPSPTKTGSSLLKPNSETSLSPQWLGGSLRLDESDNTPSFASSPVSSQSHSLDSLIPTMAALDSDRKNFGILALTPDKQILVESQCRKNMSADQLPDHYKGAVVRSMKYSHDEYLSPKTTIVQGGKGVPMPMQNSAFTSFASAAPFTQEVPAESVASRVERKLAAARQIPPPVTDAFHCPVCYKLFPRAVSRFLVLDTDRVRLHYLTIALHRR